MRDSCIFTWYLCFDLTEVVLARSETSSTISKDFNPELAQGCSSRECSKPEVRLLDLYSGCGAMSTGLCLGASLADINLVTVSPSLLVLCLCSVY